MEGVSESGEKLKPLEREKITLSGFLTELDEAEIPSLPEDEIREALEKVNVAVATLEGSCGVRISRKKMIEYIDGKRINNGFEGLSWTTNAYEDPEHPVFKQFAHRKILL